MPYIKPDRRIHLDNCIDNMVDCLKGKLVLPDDPKSLSTILGDINYCFSRIVTRVMGDISYSKIAMITGVLENIKQEFYRRIATTYENKKIIENGDIPEYES
jgi:hypothetical protein